ncbi:hypothetical protein P152DRAFT_434380 [Eremomyces bilateralis CBS 781.70]|uniref:Protein FAF1 n=1 Tax=Eremomyces bilateralis CBS 781.70 TaxID=1392243 RepID=A0A6G1G5N5_9PEZI|nr:uncharacterized protein P152DRAFT_434380 [Eremomyces bilateralis CBS 781.70]KAF1813364.1 hypothetical protein P152DRAFT_434380 [Eremomyces bilateralis CBS 781.70]
MAMLGKRKRRSPEKDARDGSESGSEEDVREVFRRHFEARFKALPEAVSKERKQDDLSESEGDQDDSAGEDGEDDWEGLSDDDTAPVEVVDHAEVSRVAMEDEESAGRAGMRAFMSSKPPSSSAAGRKPTKPPLTNDSPDSDTETHNLANDRALQKLLRESRLLSESAGSNGPLSSLAPMGRNRHKAHELHLLSLGAKGSVHAEQNVPMLKRKGMESAAREKERKRRKEAGETGVVLEKARKEKTTRTRDRGIGVGVGRFKGGTLKLSQNDVKRITGPKEKSRRGRR